jgi:hypothetical protein
MCILGHVSGGCIGSGSMDDLVSAFLRRANDSLSDVMPTSCLDFDPLIGNWGGCVSMICLCQIGEEDDKERSGKSS